MWPEILMAFVDWDCAPRRPAFARLRPPLGALAGRVGAARGERPSQGILAVHACGGNVYRGFLRSYPCGQACGGVRCQCGISLLWERESGPWGSGPVPPGAPTRPGRPTPFRVAVTK